MSKRGFSRFEALMLPIIKNWHEKANSPEIRARMGCVAGTFPLLNNVDGESITQLASLFAGRIEDKKIMIVQSDSAPYAAGDGFSNHLRSVTNDIESASDINLLAIGILTDAPRQYSSEQGRRVGYVSCQRTISYHFRVNFSPDKISNYLP